MPEKAAASFLRLQDELHNLLLDTIAGFAVRRNLPSFSSVALTEMSASLRDSAAEALMFGCNTWPLPRTLDHGSSPPNPVAANVVPFRLAS